MRKNVKLLDCTLRDGARIIDGKFTDYEIASIAHRLTDANLDYVEMGFLRDGKKVSYEGDSIFFTDPEQIEKFIPNKRRGTTYLAFIDYGMYDFTKLPPYNGKSVDGLRIGFTKKDYLKSWDDVVKCLELVKKQGYKLLIQGVNSLNYTYDEFLSVLQRIDEVHPFAFGIVDTYGAMCLEDIERLYNLVNENLNEDIAVDIHTHNNSQMAFALVQRVIEMNSSRNLIIDATLEGMGKCAGNLNLELIVEYLNNKRQYNYNFDLILDTIDEFLYKIKKEHFWGYSIPAFMGSIYMSHPNNIIYLTEKFRLTNRDIKNIISMIDVEKRQRYDYDNIQKLYLEYSATKVDDSQVYIKLKKILADRKILVIAPGNSLHDFSQKIYSYIEKFKPYVISINFQYEERSDCVFFANKKRYDFYRQHISCQNVIVTSNIKDILCGDDIVNYNSLIDRRYKYFDNSTIMLLNMLRLLKVKKIVLAGFDGYTSDINDNYYDQTFSNARHVDEFEAFNVGIGTMLNDYIKEVSQTCQVSFLTPSHYEKYLDLFTYEDN